MSYNIMDADRELLNEQDELWDDGILKEATHGWIYHACILLGFLHSPSASIQHNVPTDKQQKARAKAGRLPMYEHKVVTFKPYEGYEKKSEGSGSHASPRMHFRRGHIRRLPEGKIVPVAPCWVGVVTDGVIEKDYTVNPEHVSASLTEGEE